MVDELSAFIGLLRSAFATRELLLQRATRGQSSGEITPIGLGVKESLVLTSNMTHRATETWYRSGK